MTPTILTDVAADMDIVREEVFGPVLVASAFDDIDEVISSSNDSEYGLAAGVWSESTSNALRLANRIKAGTVWINSHAMYDASLPIGGMKQSGWGRDSGQAALDNYLELKTVCAVYFSQADRGNALRGFGSTNPRFPLEWPTRHHQAPAHTR